MKRIALALLATFAFSACGGGGGGTATSAGGSSIAVVSQSVSGDMLAYQPNRGWNYTGSLSGKLFTASLYADPIINGSATLVSFLQPGSVPNAFNGTKSAALGLLASASGYNATAYVLLNNDGSKYALGGIPGSPVLVPATLTQGTGFNTYSGFTATVQTVGAVPGANACPIPTQGATIQYTFQGQTYLISYVPGCGITQYVGNHGETFTLQSVSSYPQLGTQSTTRLANLTILDTLHSAVNVILNHQTWHPLI